MIKKLLNKVLNPFAPNKPVYQVLLEKEAILGGKLFGDPGHGRERQFFCLDERTWIWYEAWLENGQQKHVTTRYEIHQHGILKAQDGQPYQMISKSEGINFINTISAYRDLVYKEIYAR